MKTAISFRENLENAQKDLFRYAYHLTFDREDALDLLQDASLRALDNEEKFIPGTNFKFWMVAIIHNLFCNNYHKREFERRHVTHPENLYLLNLAEDSVYSTDRAYDLKEIVRTLGRLPGKYRIAFSMYASGFKYSEIAQKLRIPVGTVKSRIFIARRNLQAELKEFVQ
ncbi:ECF RNA polymerase sigma factor EcfG [termite gut metagenome]|uniref:ECF RNA polymerase sigma factor EcfG n=1 Tax=termite gut metagenome TaxID=433724 RepID=A0A5J4SAG3_9ZZZZ